jgi:hypothetical protein
MHAMSGCNGSRGDWFYDPEARRWRQTDEGGTLKRGFCQFVLDPIYQVSDHHKT